MSQLSLFEQLPSSISMQALLDSLPQQEWHDCTWEIAGPTEIDGSCEQTPIRCACGLAGVRSVNLATGKEQR